MGQGDRVGHVHLPAPFRRYDIRGPGDIATPDQYIARLPIPMSSGDRLIVAISPELVDTSRARHLAVSVQPNLFEGIYLRPV